MFCESDSRNMEIQNEFVFKQRAVIECLSKNSTEFFDTFESNSHHKKLTS